ncbi:MAG: GGDEF domain-containing protein [Solirubrobacterales bacterium]
MEAHTWLCPTELDRVRVIEANPRIRRAREVAAGACGAALLASGPWIGWWILGLFALAVANLATLEQRLKRNEHPENVAARSLVFNTVLFGVGVAFTGGPLSPALPWLVIPVGMSATRFRAPVVWAYAALTGVVAVVATVGVNPAATARHPVLLLVTLSLLAGLGAITSALTGAELSHRDAAVLDPLTGLLNRMAMESRVAELEQQASLTGDWVCYVACDLDEFKAVNDTYGHERGDAVLKAVAYEMRKTLRSFELIYRLGGEEFLVVLPGANLDDGGKIAARVRSAVASSRPGGVDLTMSVGIAAARGEGFEHSDLFRRADRALYAAKRAGRDRVEVAPEPVGAEPVGAALG